MYEDLIFPLVTLLFIIFIFFIPALLYAGFRKIANPVPFWLPLLSAVLVLLVMGGILQLNAIAKGDTLTGTLVMFFLMLMLTSLAVITPFLWLGKKIRIESPWLTFSLLSFLGVAMMFFTTMGDVLEGGPYPRFSLPLPLTGWIPDGIAALLNIQEIVYSTALPVHTLVLAAGLYLEVFIIAALSAVLLGGLFPAKNE